MNKYNCLNICIDENIGKVRWRMFVVNGLILSYNGFLVFIC